MVKMFGLDISSLSDSLAKLEGDRNAREEGISRLNDLVNGGLFSQRIADNIREKCERNLRELDEEIRELNEQMTREQMAKVLAIRCLAREKSRIYELFRRGLVNEWAFRELDYTVTVQLDEARHRGLMPTGRVETSIGKAIGMLLVKILDVVPGFGRIVEGLYTSRVIRDYDVAWGRYRSASSVLRTIENVAEEGDIDAVTTEEIRKVYEDVLEISKNHIDEVADQYPEFVETMQEQLGQRLLLVAEHDSVEHAAEMGMLQQGIAHKIMKDQAERLRLLKQDNMSACFEIEVTEILRKVPLFKDLDPSDFDLVSRCLQPKTVPRGVAIIHQGDQGDSMFLIARGIANLRVQDGNSINQIATLYAGDFFGESALLHRTPRNASALAVTPCSLYELKRKDLDGIGETYPNIKNAIEEVDRERLMASEAEIGSR